MSRVALEWSGNSSKAVWPCWVQTAGTGLTPWYPSTPAQLPVLPHTLHCWLNPRVQRAGCLSICAAVPHVSEVPSTPLCSYKRPVLEPAFTSGKTSEEHFYFYRKEAKRGDHVRRLLRRSRHRGSPPSRAAALPRTSRVTSAVAVSVQVPSGIWWGWCISGAWGSSTAFPRG